MARTRRSRSPIRVWSMACGGSPDGASAETSSRPTRSTEGHSQAAPSAYWVQNHESRITNHESRIDSTTHPGLEGRARRRPLAIEHREPGAVAIAPLDDHVLAEDALEAEAELERRAARSLVERVALPLHAAVAELVECLREEHPGDLGADAAALQRRRVPDVADLDPTHVGGDVHEA